ncbi:PilZ domain-containing protein [Desulfosarcina sp.]|uniref:PilZ domain-containing protein n=1 Tax=Desulfosarcina sp. TaxID=2027861 RepID=UPI003566FE57
MNTIANRRRHPRHIALFTAKYTVKSGTYRDLVRNVSAGGIYIISRRTIRDGQRISLRFPVLAFDKKPSVAGTVIRSHHRGFAVMFDHPVEAKIGRDGRFPHIEIKQDQPR